MDGGDGGTNTNGTSVTGTAGIGVGVGGPAGNGGTGGSGHDTSVPHIGSGGGGGGVRGGGAGGERRIRGTQGGGGGGAGYAEPSATNVVSEVGVHAGDGMIVLSAITSTPPSTTLNVGDAFSYTVTTQGFTGAGVPDPVAPSFSVTPPLPVGLSLDPNTGAISGTVTTAGTTAVTITASASISGGRTRTSSQQLVFSVSDPNASVRYRLVACRRRRDRAIGCSQPTAACSRSVTRASSVRSAGSV